MTKSSLLLALALLAQMTNASAATPPGPGFDPAKYHLPIYPKATLKPGTTVSIKGAYGRVRRMAIFATTDSEGTVAAWYAAHWPGARHQAFPMMHMDQFATGWGATNVLATITDAGGSTEIRVMVPSS